MARKTSIEAYHEIKESGLLSKRRFEVYEALFYYGPMTQVETGVKLHLEKMHSSISPRFAELRDRGVIEEIGEKYCSVTGMHVILWDVTDSLPAPLPKPKSKKEIKKELLEKIVTLGFAIDSQWKPQLRDIYRLANSL